MVVDEAMAVLRAVTLPRLLVVVACLGVPPLMWEMGYSHWRGNFHRAPMYIPVVVPPVFAAAGLLYLGTQTAWAAWTFGSVAVLLLVAGAVGVFFHVQGITRQTGGFHFDNVMVGPPMVAPLAFSGLALIGLLGLAFSGG